MAKQPSPRRRARIVGYVLLGIVVVGLLVVGILIAWLNTESGRRWAQTQVQEQAQQLAPGFSLEALNGFLPFRAQMDGLVLNDMHGIPTARVERVDADVQLAPLLGGRVRFNSVDIQDPTLIVQDTVGDQLNIEAVIIEPDPEAELPPITVEAWSVTNATVYVQSEERGEHRIDNLNANGSFRLDDDDLEITVEHWTANLPPEQNDLVSGTFEGNLEVERENDTIRGRMATEFFDLVARDVPVGSGTSHAELEDTHLEGGLQVAHEEAPAALNMNGRLTDDGDFTVDLDAEQLDTRLLPQDILANLPFTGAFSGNILVSGNIVSDGDDPLEILMDPQRVNLVVDIDQADLQLRLPEAEAPEEVPEPRDLREALEELPPFLLGRLSMKDSHVRIIEHAQRRAPEFSLSELTVTLENLATREGFMRGIPTVFTLRGLLQQSGQLSAMVVMNPMEERPTVAAQAALLALELSDIRDFLLARTNVHMPEGDFTAYVQFYIEDGYLEGGLQPMLRDVVLEAENGLGTELAVALANPLFDLFSNGGTPDPTVATVIPVEGPIDDASAEFIPAVLGILENAFLAGLTHGFTHLPPQ